MRTRKLATMMASVATVALLATACSSGSGSGDSTSGGGSSDAVLTVGMPNGVQTNNQSPFATGSSALSLGYAFAIYEPLMMVNDAKPSDAPTRTWTRSCAPASACTTLNPPSQRTGRSPAGESSGGST